jgi:peptidoglycan-N-acetylglucosamine deacetylase
MWPDRMRAAAAFTFDFEAEEVWIGDDPENANRPGVLSQGTYGAKVAVPQILELLRRHDLRATFFIPGRVAERYPERVREIIADGHEIGHHGYTHTSPANLDAAAEEDEAELPIQWVLDDAAHFWFDGLSSWTRRISAPSEVREIWEAESAGIRELGGAFVLTMHPQVIGRPGRLPLLEGMIEHVRRRGDVWVATCRELAARAG